MVPEKVKAELKRFLSAKQVEDLSQQLDTYEKRVREAVKQFDVKGREAKAKGQVQLEKFAAQVKSTSQQLEKQIKTFMGQEGKALNKGLGELFTLFRSLTAQPEKPAKKSAKAKKPRARKPRATSASRSASPQTSAH